MSAEDAPNDDENLSEEDCSQDEMSAEDAPNDDEHLSEEDCSQDEMSAEDPPNDDENLSGECLPEEISAEEDPPNDDENVSRECLPEEMSAEEDPPNDDENLSGECLPEEMSAEEDPPNDDENLSGEDCSPDEMSADEEINEDQSAVNADMVNCEMESKVNSDTREDESDANSDEEKPKRRKHRPRKQNGKYAINKCRQKKTNVDKKSKTTADMTHNETWDHIKNCKECQEKLASNGKFPCDPNEILQDEAAKKTKKMKKTKEPNEEGEKVHLPNSLKKCYYKKHVHPNEMMVNHFKKFHISRTGKTKFPNFNRRSAQKHASMLYNNRHLTSTTCGSQEVLSFALFEASQTMHISGSRRMYEALMHKNKNFEEDITETMAKKKQEMALEKLDPPTAAFSDEELFEKMDQNYFHATMSMLSMRQFKKIVADSTLQAKKMLKYIYQADLLRREKGLYENKITLILLYNVSNVP